MNVRNYSSQAGATRGGIGEPALDGGALRTWAFVYNTGNRMGRQTRLDVVSTNK